MTSIKSKKPRVRYILERVYNGKFHYWMNCHRFNNLCDAEAVACYLNQRGDPVDVKWSVAAIEY